MVQNRFHQTVRLAQWTPNWEKRYQAEAAMLRSAFEKAQYPARIRHIGSTAVQGMTAKPIIDILITVDHDAELKRGEEIMVGHGYVSMGECGRAERYFLTKGDTSQDAFYAHLTREDNPRSRDQQDFLYIERHCPIVRDSYRDLKMNLALQYSDDINLYRLAKSPYIRSVLAAYRLGKKGEADV